MTGDLMTTHLYDLARTGVLPRYPIALKGDGMVEPGQVAHVACDLDAWFASSPDDPMRGSQARAAQAVSLVVSSSSADFALESLTVESAGSHGGEPNLLHSHIVGMDVDCGGLRDLRLRSGVILSSGQTVRLQARNRGQRPARVIAAISVHLLQPPKGAAS